jgi:RbsD / FucU transport protein family
MKFPVTAVFCVLTCLCAGVNSLAADVNQNWVEVLRARIPSYGHRNWIVIADSAYPAQSKDGIETIVSHADQLDVLRTVWAELAKAKHVTPTVYMDQELNFLDEQGAKGIGAYRGQLADMFKGRTVNVLPHEQIIAKLDQVSQIFRVLIIKTDMTLPYTSIFLQLDCAYWGPDAEQRLREKMAAGNSVKK